MDTSNNDDKSIYLGIDLSTQQCKILAINSTGKIIATSSVNYEKDLNSILDSNKQEITQDARMWTRAIILAFEKLPNDFDFSKVVGISGCGQQHGSVYFSTSNFPKIEEILDEKDGIFLFNAQSPIWMDTSTEIECNLIEKDIIGGREMLKKRTGSYAFTRFTASQILKRKHCQFQKICLVSSFIPSLLTEKFCPIDYSDGSGMNLLNLKSKKWDPEISKIISGVDDMSKILENPASPMSNYGKISTFWSDKFNFNSEKCNIISFTGDNPSALIGVGGTKPNTCIISLGTSDTIFLNLGTKLPKNSKEAHVFCSPIDDNEFMALCCYRNGSLIRENLLKENNLELIQKNWDLVSNILENPKDIDLECFTMRFDLKEITPSLGPNFQYPSTENNSKSINFNQKIYNLVNGQFIAKRAHIENYLNLSKIDKLIVTGGASKNQGLLQMISNVFQSNVYVNLDSTEAAAFGGCIKAAYVLTGTLFEPELKMAASPNEELKDMYDRLVEKYLKIESQLVQ